MKRPTSRNNKALWAVWTFAFTFALLSSESALAAGPRSIGVNFSGISQNVAPADQPGIAPGANWNNLTPCRYNEGFGGCHFAITGVGTASLRDNSGALTSATIQYRSAYTWSSWPQPNTPNTATNLMYVGGLAADPTCCGGPYYGEASITVTNVPYAAYDVYVYSGPPEGPGDVPVSITNGSTTYYYSTGGSTNSMATMLTQTVSTDPNHPTAGPAQYQVFHMTARDITLTTGGSISGLIGNAVYGLQIVEATPATPATPATLTANLLVMLAGMQIQGLGNSLNAQLLAVAIDINNNNLGAACSDLTAFTNHVKAQSGKKITTAEAEQLLAGAAAIKMSIGCQ